MDSSNHMLSSAWRHTGFCYRKSQNLGDSWARLNFPVDPTRNGYYVQLFEGLFPKQVLTVVIDKVNENMHGEDDLTYGEFLWWIGMWVLMLTVDGHPKRLTLLKVHCFISQHSCHAHNLKRFCATSDTPRMHYQSIMIISGRFDQC